MIQYKDKALWLQYNKGSIIGCIAVPKLPLFWFLTVVWQPWTARRSPDSMPYIGVKRIPQCIAAHRTTLEYTEKCDVTHAPEFNNKNTVSILKSHNKRESRDFYIKWRKYPYLAFKTQYSVIFLNKITLKTTRKRPSAWAIIEDFVPWREFRHREATTKFGSSR